MLGYHLGKHSNTAGLQSASHVTIVDKLVRRQCGRSNYVVEISIVSPVSMLIYYFPFSQDALAHQELANRTNCQRWVWDLPELDGLRAERQMDRMVLPLMVNVQY